MRKFNTDKVKSRKRCDKAVFLGEQWNVVAVAGRDKHRHLYYQIKKPYTRRNGPVVRCDKLLKVRI